MKSANTKELKKYAKEICRDANLVEELGLGSTCEIAALPLLCNFPEEIQEAYHQLTEQEIQDLKKVVLELKLIVDSRALAVSIRNSWGETAPEFYRSVHEILLDN